MPKLLLSLSFSYDGESHVDSRELLLVFTPNIVMADNLERYVLMQEKLFLIASVTIIQLMNLLSV
jgi:hypothetical protein